MTTTEQLRIDRSNRIAVLEMEVREKEPEKLRGSCTRWGRHWPGVSGQPCRIHGSGFDARLSVQHESCPSPASAAQPSIVRQWRGDVATP